MLSFGIAGRALVGAHGSLDGLVVGIGGEGHVEAGLAVEGHAHAHLVFYEVLLVPLRPLCIADAALHAELLP